MNSIIRCLRRHIHFFVIVPILIIVMTWPAFVYVFETDTFWLPDRNFDAFMKLWDVWYGGLILDGRAEFFYTDLLFYPEGLSLASHNFSLPQMLIQWVLQAILPTSSAFNLTHLLLVLITTASAYLYLNYLFRDKWISLFGSIVFGTSGFVVARAINPEICTLAPLVLTLYFLHRSIVERRRDFMIVAGLLLGVTSFVGLYVLVCLCITVALYFMNFAVGRWRQSSFWLGVCLVFLVSAPFLCLRLYPLLVEPTVLDDALSKSLGKEVGFDIAANFVNVRHPLTQLIFDKLRSPQVYQFGSWVYLGYLPLFLVLAALFRVANRRILVPWLVLALCFFVLRLGSSLSIGGLRFDDFMLPKFYLEQLMPQIFKPFYRTSDFHAGLLFPFSVLCCFGLQTLLKSVPASRRSRIVLICIGLVAFEYYQLPNPRIVSAEQFQFIDWMSGEHNEDPKRLINLPMGRQPSKYYGLYQTLTGYPHAEGLAARTPNIAYSTINRNSILSHWRRGKSVQCFPGLRDEYLSDLNRLVNNGFTHVIVHRQFPKVSPTSNSFLNVPTAYEDKHVTIYRLEDLRKNCEGTLLLLPETARQLINALWTSAIIPEKGLSILQVHPPLSVSGKVEFEFTATLYSLKHTIRFANRDGGGFRAQGSGGPLNDADGLLNWRSMILLSYDPSLTDRALLYSYEAWVEGNFKTCGRIQESEHSVVEYFVKPIFPCSLVIRGDAAPIEYDNGMELGHLVHEFVDEKLDTYMLWSRRLFDKHSVSIQIFDKDNVKVLGDDFVISHAPLAYHRIDLSSLPSGEYVAKMILYNYETRVSVPGIVTSSDTRFKREFEFARLTID